MSPSPAFPSAAILHALHYAACKHRDQRRGDPWSSPLINHPIEVAALVANDGQVQDNVILQAALLHDVVEATDTSFEELEAEFGPEVTGIVRECTDDRDLPRAVQKQRQLERAPLLSAAARQIRIADKISNVRSVTIRPEQAEKSADVWPPEQRRAYREWAQKLVDAIRGANPALEALFDEACREAIRVEAS